MKSQDIRKSKSVLNRVSALSAGLLLLVSCAGFAAEKTTTTEAKPVEAKTAETKSTEAKPSSGTKSPASAAAFVGCDSPVPLTRTDRLAVLAKVALDAENEFASEIESAPPTPPATAAPTTIESQEAEKAAADLRQARRSQVRDRVGTFAAGSVSDSIPLISMDRSCWASFYGAQQKLAEGDEIGALSDSREWKECLKAMYPDRVAIAQPYFSCFSSRSYKRAK